MSALRVLQDEFLGTPDSLFHLPAFHRMHRAERPGAYFELFDGRQVRASIHFTKGEGAVWRSPARGTFGGLWADPELTLAEVQNFLLEVDARLLAAGARRAEVIPMPQAHDPVGFARSVYLLRGLGYEIEGCDLNHSLAVDGRPLAERMSYGNRKRLKKCLSEGLAAQELARTELSPVYQTLAKNREAKGWQLSMTLQQVEDMANRFSDRLLLFGVPAGDALVAAALCLSLSKDVLYVFYWGDRPGFSTASPVVALAECIYRHCQRERYALLDVGTSTIDREPNHGLIRFKQGLGFSESLKLRLFKTF
uniref:GNAT family N-acetyltransferase n=1 Tax=uncultured Sphingomonas sp. TaxID=158754 RepID=UPI0025F14241|nr:GNAT family N-acetyltransferase [uncultured Sphingomonas sp.]